MVCHCTECPANFTYIASVNGCYQLVTHKLDWTSAGQECRSLHKDAHLLVINDEQEQWSVAQMMESVRCKCLFSYFFLYYQLFLNQMQLQLLHFFCCTFCCNEIVRLCNSVCYFVCLLVNMITLRRFPYRTSAASQPSPCQIPYA